MSGTILCGSHADTAYAYSTVNSVGRAVGLAQICGEPASGARVGDLENIALAI